MTRSRLIAVALATALLFVSCRQSSSQTLASKAPTTCKLPAKTADHGTEAATGDEITLEAGDTFFAPTCVTDTAQGTVSITVRNTGSALHNFSIASQGIDEDADKGKTIRVDVRISVGSTPFFCKYHRTSGMVGVLLSS
jgi:plastocyanin